MNNLVQGNQKAIAAGFGGGSAAYAAVQFQESFFYLFTRAGLPEIVANELTTVANVIIGALFSALITYFVKNTNA